MTVETQLKEALANAKSLQANFETFSLQTKDEKAKEKYAQAAEQMQTLVTGLETRVNKVEQKEPEYRRQD
ncbi:DUF1657 domain-containing protein [Bacillus shivajii]|uniref:DUF1657 domain-containing protein n=1 Tax=Bacillus shivajii TaxID=1983719 RepID=UPI001CFADECE|nr:DUF1657 domain-containing protein [Bacillus shivajii]UCZ52597.1 DUF1657 domain-containing protein [Bacillus shivajii]